MTCPASLGALCARGLRQAHAGALVTLAQTVYDAWDPSNEDEYAGGGICHLIADRLSGYLNEQSIDARTVSSCHEQHVYVVAALADGVYLIDVPYAYYERGAGYQWTKVPGVRFTSEHLAIDHLDDDPARIDAYCDD